MSKYYAQWRRPKPKPRPWDVHPIWRGIGCLMLIIVPLLAYGLALLTIPALVTQRYIFIPSSLFGPSFSPFLYFKLILTVLYVIGLFGLFTIVYSFVYRLVGPSKYSPIDSPPIKRRSRRRN